MAHITPLLLKLLHAQASVIGARKFKAFCTRNLVCKSHCWANLIHLHDANVWQGRELPHFLTPTKHTKFADLTTLFKEVSCFSLTTARKKKRRTTTKCCAKKSYCSKALHIIMMGTCYCNNNNNNETNKQKCCQQKVLNREQEREQERERESERG